MNGKPSSPVLRGLGASDGARLLDHHAVSGHFHLSDLRGVNQDPSIFSSALDAFQLQCIALGL
jgi:hypothetical protein